MKSPSIGNTIELLSACEAVFFDIDGTLVDSNEFHVIAWAEAFSNDGRDVPRHVLREQIGKGSDMLIPSLFPGVGHGEQKALSDAHGHIFQSRFLNLVRPFAFASDLIHMLHEAGKQVLLVSSSDNKEIEHYAGLLGIERDLTGTVGYDDVNQTKPAGDLFSVALCKARVEGTKAVAVGDTPYDVEAAAKCGVGTIALRSGGFTDERLRAVAPLAIVTSINTLFSGLGKSLRGDGNRHGAL